MAEDDVLDLDYEADFPEPPPERPRADTSDKNETEEAVRRFNAALSELNGLGDRVVAVNAMHHKALSDRQIKSIKNQVDKILAELKNSWGALQCFQCLPFKALYWGSIRELILSLEKLEIRDEAELEVFLANKEATEMLIYSICEVVGCDQEKLFRRVHELMDYELQVKKLCEICSCSPDELENVFQNAERVVKEAKEADEKRRSKRLSNETLVVSPGELDRTLGSPQSPSYYDQSLQFQTRYWVKEQL